MRRRESNILSKDYHSPTNIELNLTSPRCWKTPFERPNVFLMSISISMSLPRIGKEKKGWIPEKGIQVFPLQKFLKGCTNGSANKSVYQQTFPSYNWNKPIEQAREKA